MNAEPEGGPRQPALPAARLAELRRERAERLVRLRGGPDAPRTAAPGPAADADAEPALAAFLRALRAAIEDAPPAPTGADAPALAPIAAAAPAAAVLPFLRAPARSAAREADPSASPAPPAAPGDLDRLPGVGPGLVWALEQAGIARLADLAASAPAPLADRLGPIGGLIDLPDWIAFARSATGAPPTA